MNKHSAMTLAALAVAALLTACGKDEAPAPAAPEVAQGPSMAGNPAQRICSSIECMNEQAAERDRKFREEQEAKLQKDLASAPKPDLTTPDSVYREPTSNYDYGVLAQAFGTKMSDEEIGNNVLSVALEGDQFKKLEKQNAVVAEFKAKVDALKGNRYVVVPGLRMGLSPFDMTTKSFGVGKHDGMTLGMNSDATRFDTQIRLVNGKSIPDFVVEDLDKARAIESARASYKMSLTATYYIFIAGNVPGEDDLAGVVTRVDLVDQKGNVIGSLRPKA